MKPCDVTYVVWTLTASELCTEQAKRKPSVLAGSLGEGGGTEPDSGERQESALCVYTEHFILQRDTKER